MVIGFDGSRAFVGERTGTENYSYQLLKALAKIDKKNQYLVYIRPTICPTIVDKDVGWPENFQFKEIPWPRLWTQGGLALQTFKDQLDVLFVPAHTLPLFRRPGLKTVVTVHDLGSEYLPSMHQLKQRLYLGLMQKYQLRTATKLIAVSKATKEDLVKRIGIDPEKASVVYEGFDQNLFKPVKNLQPKTYYLFVGTVQPRKNLERLIRAYSQLSVLSGQLSDIGSSVTSSSVKKSETDKQITEKLESENRKQKTDNRILKLVIVGSRGWMSEEIYKLPQQLGIKDRVKFLGYVPEKDLPALYAGAIALTFPSLFEGFGLPILEAQACGCPVLTSNVSSMPEVGGKGAVYVDPYAIDDIVEDMERLQVTGYRLQLIKNGFENIKRFSWEKCARETLKVLKSLR